jgi:DNA-binding LytR/AlgR family response regulator
MNAVKMSATEHNVLNAVGGDSADDMGQQSRAHSDKIRVTEDAQASSRLQPFGAPHSARVAIKVKGTIQFINLGEIIAVQANGNYVSLEQRASKHLLRESFWRVAEMFEPCGFIRIHRSVLINTSFVVQIRPRVSGGYCLRVAGGKEYQVTRMYKKNLKSLTDYWIGTGALFLE